MVKSLPAPRLRALLDERPLSSHLFDVINIALLLGVIFVTLYPMYYIAIVSISDGKEVLLQRVRYYPRGLTLQSYQIVLRDPTIIRSLFNSILYTSTGTLINLVLSTLCAYPLSRPDFSGRKLLTLYVAFTMLFSGGLIPLYLVVLQLGLLDTMWAIVLVPAINAFYMFIMRTYFQGQPAALHEAAIIDGATKLQRTRFIDVPGIMPTAVIMFILTLGQLMNIGFEKVFNMQNDLNLERSEVIQTYVYKIGLTGIPRFSYASAIGLFNSVINFVLIMVVNWTAKRLGGASLW